MSLRWRLILSHTLIVVLCLAIVAVAVSALLQGYRNRFAMARLDDMTIPIYIQARSLARGEASLDEVWANLREQAQETGVYIFLVDDEGNIVRQASPGEGIGGRLDKLPAGALPHDLSGPYHGSYVMPKGQTFIFAAYPLAGLFGSQSPSLPEALVLAVPRAGALALWAGFSRPFLWAGLIALAVSVVIAVFLARSVYRPIQRVTDAAEEIARGRYDQEIALAGPREVRGLALAFNRMAKQVKHSQQRLREFLADVSHELRSPLTSIRGFAQAMVDGTARDSEAQSRAAQIIEDESKRMIRLVDELLELSRIESGQIQMLREPVDVKALLEHCQEIFMMRAQEKGLRLRADLEPLPSIVGDTDRLEQVFSNLLDNALKHTPLGGEISISARQASSDLVEITVADTGPGISPQELPHVFGRFYRADAAKTGTGLGLAIAREIVRAHGGDIEARSALGGGAQFIVRLATDLPAAP
ncbi:MAG: sensor histidine kinase [Dehalococcoidia bacterium]